MDFKIENIYEQNLNFLIGAGASSDIFPTLALKIRDEENRNTSVESLAERFSNSTDKRLLPLFLHYYNTCIRPVETFSIQGIESEPQKENIKDYEDFTKTIIQVLNKRSPLDKRCNIFTTNYDGCFSLAADKVLCEGGNEFVINDGGRGFHRRLLEARHFNSFLCQTGVFERHLSSLPQLNLIHMHGSIYWKKSQSAISIDYSQNRPDLLNAEIRERMQPFSATLFEEGCTVADLNQVEFTQEQEIAFWKGYKELPIVSPTKKKFYETVFEEHYYQMLRLLSYELEKPDTVFVCFGFSFADEHILRLFKRSLANPRLCVYICCYNDNSQEAMQREFSAYRNVKLLRVDGNLNFQAFNRDIFTLSNLTKSGSAAVAEVA